MPDQPKATALGHLQRALNNPQADFRDGQWEAIEAIAYKGERLLVVQRTGWGKSSVYFIATRILRDRGRGPTLIVSPLLALMRNQVEAAERLGIKALTINSTNQDQWPEFHRRILNNEVDALLISPERLANDDFVQSVLLPIASSIGLLVVDEAHCISDWGHDFRPDYRRLINVLKRMPENLPILGTTATANNRVIEDVVEQLGNIGIQRGPLMRETLSLQTLKLPSQSARLAWLAEHIPNLPGTGIVYVLTKRDADQVSAWLNEQGISSRAYYSDAEAEGFEDSNSYREHLERQLLGNEIKVLVATSALGMGYDKPDLGFVIHYQAPDSIVAYYQQVGRAGRAIDNAIGVLISGDEDGQIHDYFRQKAFPDEKWVKSILGALERNDGLKATQLEEAANLRRGQISQVLKLLSVESPAPVLKDGAFWRRTPVRFELDHDRIARLTHRRETEWGEVQAYVHEGGCLMQFLAHALDDANPQPCGKCSNCLGHSVVPATFGQDLVVEAARYLRQAELPLKPRKQIPSGALVAYPFRGNLPAELQAETGRVLSRWGDAGWGKLVADCKHNGSFSDELVEAVAEMVIERWKPDPSPTWITCIPSTRHPDLVPNFADKLSKRLGIPFVALIKKVHANAPQKGQENSFHQCRNLDGVFAIEPISFPNGPGLLIDDVVDSGWTMTIAAALLRQAGSGPILPVALATSGVDG